MQRMLASRVAALTAVGALALLLAGCGAASDPASEVAATRARLNARGQSGTTPAHYYFAYAADPSDLGTPAQFTTPVRSVPANTVGPGGSNILFSERVAALRPGKTYSFRVCGGDGQIQPDLCAPARSFTTQAGNPAVDLSTSTTSSGVNDECCAVIADVNRDGNPDLLTGASSVFGGGPRNSTGPVVVLIGDGHGGFAAPVSVGPLGSGAPSAMAAGDFNNDGRVDLAYAMVLGKVQILLGDGNGGFSTGAQFAFTGAIVLQLVARDVNGDGRRDLVGVSGFSGGGPSSAFVALGNGNGGFSVPAPVDAAERPVRVAVRDVNLDGRPDLVLATTTSQGLSLLLGKGDGSLWPPLHTALPSGSRVLDVVVADLNRDGRPDALVSTQAGDGWRLTGKTDGTLASPVAVPNLPNTPLAVGDLTGDARLDVVGHAFEQIPPQTRLAIRVLPGNGDGTFQTPNDFPADVVFPAIGLPDLAIADLNRDGRPDVASTGEGETGSGNFGFEVVGLNTTPR